MDKSQEPLLPYLEQFDPDEELKKLSYDEIEEWMKEEWTELAEDSVSTGEATSIIIDSYYKWMYQNSNRKLFVYKKLLELNSTSPNNIKKYLNDEIDKLMLSKAEKKSKHTVKV